MRRTIGKFEKVCESALPLACLAAALFLTVSFPSRSGAQEKGQKTYPSSEAAANALLMAIDANDTQTILTVLGPGANQIISSGNETEDAEHRANFCRRYLEMHRLVNEPDGTTTLYIGAENWPVPFPLVQKGGAWHFDTEAGVKEITFRRIGHNEMAAIRVCHELVEAEKEFYSQQNHRYASRIASDPGEKDGLYWPVSGNEPESPIGPLIAGAAIDEGAASGQPAPFHGYFFRVLTRQGKNAQGGAADYIVDGKLTGGFAVLAFPAEYRVTGVVVFLVSKDGVVFEKDLGEKTGEIAKSMNDYDPDSSWQKTEERAEQTASDQKPK